MFRRKMNDLEILKILAEYRMLTLSQITILQFSSKQTASRRLAQLVQQGFVESLDRGFGQGPGRPESLFALTPAGVRLLKEAAILDPPVPDDKVIGAKLAHCVEHQLPVNWFRIHLRQIENVLPHLSVWFLAPTSPFLPEDKGSVLYRSGFWAEASV